jgi:chemotaxis protein CheD
MDAFSFQQRDIELNAINIVQGAWVIQRERVLRTILGSCVSVCLYDPVARLGGMNHFVYPPRNGGAPTTQGATTMAADICMEGLLEALLRAGGRRERLLAKAFGGGAMFAQEGGPLAVGKRNASYAKYWLEKEAIPLTMFDFHGNCARKLMFHPASGQHLCKRLPATFSPSLPIEFERAMP